MAHREFVIDQPLPQKIAEIIPQTPRTAQLIFATTNVDKLNEYAVILGDTVNGKRTEVDEIQEVSLRRVVEDKAIKAWEKNDRQPIIVEDSGLELHGWGDGLPGALVKHFVGSATQRQVLCDIAQKAKDMRATFRVMFAVFDGKEVHVREGITDGTITKRPRGKRIMGFDDIFEPDGQVLSGWFQKRTTFSEMTLEQKSDPRLSPRTKALLKVRDDPFIIGKYAYQLPEPYQMQLDAIDKSLFDDERVRTYAFGLEALENGQPRKAYFELEVGGEIKRYVTDKSSSQLGILVTPMDTARDFKGRPKRMELDNANQPIFWQVGPEATNMAAASRAQEFKQHHNEEMYSMLREMMSGALKTPERSNVHSPVIEHLISMLRVKCDDPVEDIEDRLDEAYEILGTAGLSELGYARISSDRQPSRTKASRTGLFLTTSGIPTALFSLGDMPPVSGWRDVLVTSALSYMDSYIPRNSIYVDNVDLQLKLFHEAEAQIKSLLLPGDIEQLCLAHIGISVGCENPNKVALDVKRMFNEGVRSIRVSSTNPGNNLVETARLIREELKDLDIKNELRLCVGTITDFKQAEKLINPDIHVNKILIGHGGGENCTSLSGGGAANSLELLYLMSIDSRFNSTALGLEGGTGDSFGAILGMVDTISLNRRGIAGGIETGGLFVQLANGKIGQPYWGSASPATQWTEAMVSPRARTKRIDLAGRLMHNEGKMNYAEKHQVTNSVVDNWHYARMLAGRALADQDAMSLAELRENITHGGDYNNHRSVTDTAFAIANEHRSN